MKKDLHKKLQLKRDNIPSYPIGSSSQHSISKNKLPNNKILKINKKSLTIVFRLISKLIKE